MSTQQVELERIGQNSSQGPPGPYVCDGSNKKTGAATKEIVAAPVMTSDPQGIGKCYVELAADDDVESVGELNNEAKAGALGANAKADEGRVGGDRQSECDASRAGQHDRTV
jgi:hypothetical protein